MKEQTDGVKIADRKLDLLMYAMSKIDNLIGTVALDTAKCYVQYCLKLGVG